MHQFSEWNYRNWPTNSKLTYSCLIGNKRNQRFVIHCTSFALNQVCIFEAKKIQIFQIHKFWKVCNFSRGGFSGSANIYDGVWKRNFLCTISPKCCLFALLSLHLCLEIGLCMTGYFKYFEDRLQKLPCHLMFLNVECAGAF